MRLPARIARTRVETRNSDAKLSGDTMSVTAREMSSPSEIADAVKRSVGITSNISGNGERISPDRDSLRVEIRAVSAETFLNLLKTS
jgi:hypothetical protein